MELDERSVYFIFSPGSLCSSESGRCRTLPFFLKFLSFHLSRFSFYINIFLCFQTFNVSVFVFIIIFRYCRFLRLIDTLNNQLLTSFPLSLFLFLSAFLFLSWSLHLQKMLATVLSESSIFYLFTRFSPLQRCL